MLTIKQLADYVGVTVRAVRHYHRLGLLAEPERDQLGYRRYGAQDVVDLQRIKVLADAGVPLARVKELLESDPDGLAAAQRQIDADLRRRVRELQATRRRLKALVTEQEPFLPAQMQRVFARFDELGVSPQTKRLSRDGWILASVVFPKVVPAWVDWLEACLDDPEYRRLFVLADQARDWDPDDPRLNDLAQQTVAWVRQHLDDGLGTGTGPDEWTLASQDQVGLQLVQAYDDASSPAMARLSALVREQLPDLAGPDR